MARLFSSLPVAFFGRQTSIHRTTVVSESSIDEAAEIDRAAVRAALRTILCLLAIGVLLACLGGSLPYGQRAVPALGFLLVVAIGSICCGAVIGFVFGIPRALQITDAPKGNGEPSQLINTNLEQISDWLTKIIVGVSLVQAHQIFTSLLKASERLGKGLVGFDPNLATGIMAATIVAGLVIGFLTMYIETRTFLSTMFLRTAKIERHLSQTDLNVLKDAPVASTGPQKVQLSTDQRAAVNRVAAQPLSSAKTPEEQASWAKASFWQGNYAAAADGYAQALATQTENYQWRREYGRALTMAGRADLAVAEFDKARELAARAKDVNAVRDLNVDRVWVQLYRPVDGFENAIELGKKLMADDPALTADPKLQTYMACAYGQKYRVHSIQENAELAGEAAEEAKGAINRVIAATRIDTSWRQFLRVLASGQSADDDDLAFLAKERPDVRKLIDDATNT